MENNKKLIFAFLIITFLVNFVLATEQGFSTIAPDRRVPEVGDQRIEEPPKLNASTEGPTQVVPFYAIDPSSEVHQWIAYQARYIWTTSEIDQYNYLMNNYDDALDENCYNPNEGILIGSGEEDRCGNLPFSEHFWDPDNSDNGNFNDGLDYLGISYSSSYTRAENLYSTAKSYYLAGDKNQAYYYLGRVAHLLEDATVPAHVHLDAHPGFGFGFGGDDEYELFTANTHYPNAWGDGPNFKHFNGSNYINQFYKYENLPWWNDNVNPSASNLFKLFYYTAQKTQHFASDDVNGNNLLRLLNDNNWYCFGTDCDDFDWLWESDSVIVIREKGDVESGTTGNKENLKKIAEANMPHAMKAVAGLYRLFWIETHSDISVCSSGTCCDVSLGITRSGGSQPTGFTDFTYCDLNGENKVWKRDFYCPSNSNSHTSTDYTLQVCSLNQICFQSSHQLAECVADTDSDGVVDLIDSCPTISGNYCNGCQKPLCAEGYYSFCPQLSPPYCIQNLSYSPGCINPAQIITINSSLTFCEGTYSKAFGFTITKDNVNIKCNNTLIIGNKISANPSFNSIGFFAENKINITIIGCNIQNYTFGIKFNSINNSNLLNNFLTYNYHGLALAGNSNKVIKNVFTNSDVNNVILYNSFNSYLFNNTVNNPGTRGFEIYSSNNNKISYNNISNSFWGIDLYNSKNNSLFRNVFSNDLIGIYLSHNDTETNIELNQFSQCGTGIALDGDIVRNNYIHKNLLVDSYNFGIRLINEAKNNSIINNSFYLTGVFDQNQSLNTYCVNNISNYYYSGATGPTCPIICTPNLINATWSVWTNVSCLTNNKMNQTSYTVQYNINNCGNYTNKTIFEYRSIIDCDYCKPNPVNTTFSGWKNQTFCLLGDYYIQNRSKIEYDSNYGSCYKITNLTSDLWNNGINKTHWEFRNQSCAFPDQDNDGFCKNGYQIENVNLQCSKEKGIYGSDCDDNNLNVLPPYNNMKIYNNTYFCSGNYYVPNGISVESDNLILDCNGSKIIGNLSVYSAGVVSYLRNNITIKNCVIFNYTSGISLLYSNKSLVKNNTISNFNYPGATGLIIANGAKDNLIDGNIIEESYYGSIIGDGSSNNIFSGNFFLRNDVSGILLQIAQWPSFPIDRTIRDNNIINNFFLGNHEGIMFMSSGESELIKYNNVTKNIFSNQTWVATVFGGQYNNIWDNQLYHNNLLPGTGSNNSYCVNSVGNNYFDGSTGPTCPAICPTVYNPVCGINNITYTNSCFANSSNIEIQCSGLCPCSSGNVSNSKIKVFSPQPIEYQSRKIPINLTVNISVPADRITYYDYSEDRARETILCRNCLEYGNTRVRTATFGEGEHLIGFRAYNGGGVIGEENVSFFIDSIEPRFLSTIPVRGFASGIFNVTFTEENPEKLILFYGNSIKQHEVNISKECQEGRRGFECSTKVNLTEFNGNEIQYWFNLTDKVGNSENSRARTLDVDTSPPIINSFVNTTNGRRVTFIFNITELNFDEINYIDWNDERHREIRLCSTLRNGICSSTKTFSVGAHNLTINVLDEAGNNAQKITSFSII